MSDLLQIDELLGGIVLQKRFKNGMNFTSSDVNLNLASSLKQLKSKPKDHENSKLIRIKGSIFKWIKEEPLLSKKNIFGDLNPFIFLP
ncbi:hypothetical protein GHT06_010497 [Daphnia sinensis]|uniref:Uncharacterized protein n=1 Tax=Daphnia sinensis TaxID=1820382 RepID=A0AAD5Q165_9CRUS|nr:hypothetical protein GHT06_010497 [Daphnia sinensis]